MYVYDHNSGRCSRAFSQYHEKMMAVTCQAMADAGISCKFTDFNNLEKDVIYQEDLLIVVSQDFLRDYISEYCPGPRLSKALDLLSALGKPVLILTAVHEAELDYDNVPPNVRFLHYGGDLLFQMIEYPKVEPQKQKNINMTKFWLATCQAPRLHRMITACWCLGTDLAHGFEPETGTFRISFHEIVEFEDWRTYWLSCYPHAPQVTADQSEILQRGFDMVKQVIHGGQPAGDVYSCINSKGVCDNAQNFDQHLRVLYRESLIEIVLETTFFSRGKFITEKFLNSVYGYTMPILISTPGAVEYLRTHGFDMFDDVVDHSYDLVQDPAQRIITAIDCNRQLLTDKQYAWSAWQNCLSRLDKNVDFAKTKMYDNFCQIYRQNLSEYITRQFHQN